MLPRFLLILVLLAPASIGVAREYDAAFDNLSNIPDRRGNFISISNRMAGNGSQVRVTSLNRYGNINWDVSHDDGNIERATSFFIDGSGAIVVAGVRLRQGINYVWLLKYSTYGQFLWENADTMPGCAAFDIVANPSGDIWVAATCVDGQNYPVRIMHYGSNGNLRWAQNYSEGARNYVRNLNLDFMSRVSLTLEIDNGSSSRNARTIVYDTYGTRLAAY